MSIIHQALKKVQAKLGAGTPPSTDSQQPVNPTQLAITDEQRQHIRLGLLIVLPLLTVGALFFFYKQMAPVIKQTTNINLPKNPIALVAPSTPAPKAENKPIILTSITTHPVQNTSADTTDIQLQGIMAQGNDRVALINNNVYQVGDLVNGMKIIAINEASVVIDDAGQQTTYKLSR